MKPIGDIAMLKQVGLSGQISLGKRHAGRLFDLVAHADGRLELIPMTLVDATGIPTATGAPDMSAPVPRVEDNPAPSPPQWRPPGGYAHGNAWAAENRTALEAHARETDDAGTAADQLQQFLDAARSGAKPGDGPV